MSFVEYIKDPNFWITFITAAIAIIALFQSNYQIKISNKQQLFDRRLEKYLLIKDLLSLYLTNRNLLFDKKDVCKVIDYIFFLLTNCSTLETMCSAISKPLSQEEQKIFLEKCEMLDKTSTEIQLIWNGTESILIGSFVKEYCNLLRSMYKQQVFIKRLREQNDNQPMLLEIWESKLCENADNVNLFKTIDNLEKIYQEIIITNAVDNLKKHIKL